MKKMLRQLKRTYFRIKNSDLMTNHNARKSFMIIVLVLLLLSRSFAWLYDEYVGSGALVTTGTIAHSVIQYDSNGEEIDVDGENQTLIYESNMSNITRSSKFIEVRNNGTLDMEYSLTFSLEGTIETAGIMYYRLYEITNDVNATTIGVGYDTKIETYAHNNPIDTGIETDTSIPIQNLSLMNNLIKIDTVAVGGNKYYRLDYGVYSSVNTSAYSGQSLSIHMNVYSSQVGVISAENREGQVWNVQNATQLREILNTAVSGDTIRLLENVEVTGSINISKRISLDMNGYNLNITGDLIYEYVNLGEATIDVTGDGTLTVGNDFYINTPKAEINVIGENSSYDIVVGGNFIVNALQDGEEDGLYIQNARIVKSETSLVPADITIMSNTRLTIGQDVDLGIITAYPGSTNIEIVNNGSVIQMDFSEMSLLTTYTKAQIYVYNLSTIYGILGSTGIVLPSSATPYLGPNNGNTLIIKGITSGDITVGGSENFNNSDIEFNNQDSDVIPIENEDNAFIVYIKEPTVSLESLLTDYFRLLQVPNISSSIASIKKLVVYTLNAQYFENEDFDYAKSNALYSLEYLNLANSRVIDGTNANKIKASAMEGKTSLKTMILPKNLTEIGEYAFKGINLGYIPASNDETFNFVTIPSSVTRIGAEAFNNTGYVKMQPLTPPVIEADTFANNSKMFVNIGVVDSYRTAQNYNEAHIYRNAELSDDRRYFVFSTNYGMGISYLVNNYIAGSSLGVSSTVSYQGTDYNTTELSLNSFREANIVLTNGIPVVLPDTVTKIGDHAFYGRAITNIALTNVTEIGNYAFYNTKVTEAIGNNILSIGNHAFENALLERVSFTHVNTIGEYAFNNNQHLFSMDLGVISNIGEHAFYDCPNVAKVYFSNINSSMVNNEEKMTMTIGEDALFNSWGSYIDGRLRVYVPDATSALGNTYTKLYKKLFGSENARYVYKRGIEIGSYTHLGVAYPLSKYTVKEVSMINLAGQTKTGLEIISYQGPDLSGCLDENIEYEGTQTMIVSIGENAFINSTVAEDEEVYLNSNNLVNIGDSAFEGFNIKSAVNSGLRTIGKNAFKESTITYAYFEGLESLGEQAFYNCDTLYRAKLGSVSIIGAYALANTDNLTGIFINNMSRAVNYDLTAFEAVGSNVNDRFRMYVPEEDIYVNYFKSLLPNYATYIYPTGTIIGHYRVGSINFDIGEYSVREVTKKNANNEDVTSYEIIEYHGEDLDNDFAVSEILTPNNDSLQIEYSWTYFTNDRGNVTFTLSNTGDEQITDWQFDVALPGNMAMTGWTNGTNTVYDDYITIGPASYNRIINAGSRISFSSQFTRTDTNLSEELDILDIRATTPGNTGYEIISIGANAFSHVRTLNNNFYNLSSNKLLSIGENGFANMSGIKSVSFPNVVTIGAGAFNNSSITSGTFLKLKNLGARAFSNTQRLYKLDLNKVSTMGSKAISNAPNLYQVFFSASGNSLSLDFAADGIYNVGSSTNGRMRFYVSSGATTDGTEYVTTYKNSFGSDYRDYFYAYDYVVGSYTPPGLADTIDIGQYTIKDIERKNVNQTTVSGFEFVEYHGDDMDEYFDFPDSLLLSDSGVTATFGTPSQGYWSNKYYTTVPITIINNNDFSIATWKVVFDLTTSGTISEVSQWNNGGSWSGYRVTVTNPSSQGAMAANGGSVTVNVRIAHSASPFTPELVFAGENIAGDGSTPVISIGDNAFSHTIPGSSTFTINSDNLLYIGNNAFLGNTSVGNITVPNVITIGENSFASASNLKTAYFNKLQNAGSAAFRGASNLTIASLGNISTFNDNLLFGTTHLAKLYVKNTTMSSTDPVMDFEMGNDVFKNMGSATGSRLRIYVPIGGGVSGTTYLDAYKATFPSDFSNYIYDTGFDVGTYTYNGVNIGSYTVRKTTVNNTDGWQIVEYHGSDISSSFTFDEQLTIGEDSLALISLGPKSFYHVALESGYIWDLDLPSGIINVGDYAFYQRNVQSLTGVNMYHIGSYAFAESETLITVTFDSISTIADHAFYRCLALNSVNLGTDVLEIGDFAFYNSWSDNNLSAFYINTDVPPTIYQNTLPAIFAGDSTPDPTVYVPYDSIRDYERADYWEDYIIESIGSIYNSTYVYEITGNNSVKILKYISNNSTLLFMPESIYVEGRTRYITAIEPDAFDSSTRLRYLYIPSRVVSLGNGFLENNRSVRYIYVNGSNDYYSSYDGVLYTHDNEVLIRFPNVYDYNYYDIPSGTKVIANGAFSGNRQLRQLTIPSSVVAISDGAFNGATNLSRFTFYGNTPPYITGFEAFPMNAGLRIYYPSGASAAYTSDLFYSWYSSYLYAN